MEAFGVAKLMRLIIKVLLVYAWSKSTLQDMQMQAMISVRRCSRTNARSSDVTIKIVYLYSIAQ